MAVFKALITFLICYLLGSISFAVIFSKIAGKDVRGLGSGNAGSTNMLRNFGFKWALLTFAGDFLKGSLGVFLAGIINAGSPHEAVIKESAVIFLLLGHMKPVFFSFKGGKGVATGLGALAVVAPKIFLIIFVLGFTIAAVSGFVSLAAISMSSLYPVMTVLAVVSAGEIKDTGAIIYIAIAFLIGAMILYSHRANFKRLINHEENSIYKKRRASRG